MRICSDANYTTQSTLVNPMILDLCACDMKIDMKKKKRKVDNAFALTEDTFKDSTKLHKSVKRIDLQVRVGNGWVSAGEEPATKKRRAEEKIDLELTG
ncbi:unnamed protein product [Rhizophagus irregularis]|nr:unnamed protein product [Rhizophagus irregularis]